MMDSFTCISLNTMKAVSIPVKNVIALGNFDGVHLAHRTLLRQTKQLRDTAFTNAACTVFCFSSPPTDLLLKNPPARIYTLEQKLEAFREEGMEYAVIADFSTLCELSPREFAKEILEDACGCVGAVCGFNYRFGKGGSGTAEILSSVLNATVCTVPEIVKDGVTVSSTYIRHLIDDGNVEEAAILLAKPFSFSSSVLHGKRLGRTLGFPTVNQFFSPKSIIPCRGVYLTECELESKQIVFGVSNVGTHPTVDRNAPVNCETYLLDFDGDLYGQTVRVSFLKRIRAEMKFRDAIELKKQVFADIEYARMFLKNNSK